MTERHATNHIQQNRIWLIKVLPYWSAQIHDINIIERMWKKVKRRVRQKNQFNFEELWELSQSD